MEYQQDELLSIGEFMRLLNTTRATLTHYDKIGVLKPAYIEENGYRYYRPEQAQTYLLVTLFSECGLPLKEIKGYLKSLDKANGENLVEESLDLARRQIRKLTQVERLMSSKQQLYNLALEHDNEIPFLRYFEDQKYFRSTIRGLPASQQQLQTDHSISISRYITDHGEFPEHPFCGRMQIARDENGISLSAPSGRDQNAEIYNKVAGMYACKIKHGTRYSREAVVQELYDFAEKQDYVPDGDLYMIDTVNFCITNNEDEYSTLFQIHVQRKN